MKKDDLPLGMMDQPDHVIAHYRAMVKAGESPRIAEICACRKAPAGETDTSHFAGMKPLEATAGPEYAKKVRAQARAAGIEVSGSSIYNATIADARGGGDPNAWLLAGDGRAKWRKAIEAKGGECDSLKVKASGKSLELFAKKEQALARRKARKQELQAEAKEKMRA